MIASGRPKRDHRIGPDDGSPFGASAHLVTCEHGGNEVPPAYADLLREHADLLDTHAGYDPGALEMAQDLAHALAAPLIASTTTRLLVDLNRSVGHPQLYSQATRRAPPSVRREILAAYYLPYRTAVEGAIESALALDQRVLHIASHSFTPELDGETRHADVGLLYDPARPAELAFCRRWEAAFAGKEARLRVRRNYPYSGSADRLTTAMRRKFAAEHYVGVELEINQRLVTDATAWESARRTIVAGLVDTVTELERP